jgi:hypothetical protein
MSSYEPPPDDDPFRDLPPLFDLPLDCSLKPWFDGTSVMKVVMTAPAPNHDLVEDLYQQNPKPVSKLPHDWERLNRFSDNLEPWFDGTSVMKVLMTAKPNYKYVHPLGYTNFPGDEDNHDLVGDLYQQNPKPVSKKPISKKPATKKSIGKKSATKKSATVTVNESGRSRPRTVKQIEAYKRNFDKKPGNEKKQATILKDVAALLIEEQSTLNLVSCHEDIVLCSVIEPHGGTDYFNVSDYNPFM